MITGNGTAESHYIISGDDITTAWNELIEAIKKDGVYVDLDKAYAFDIDEIYRDKDIPDGIQIGYGTSLDGKGSSFTSRTLKAESFDFEGRKAEVVNFTTLAYKESPAMANLVLVENYSDFIVAATSGNYGNTRIKCVPDIVQDYNDVSSDVVIKITPKYTTSIVLQCEDMVIKNSREFVLKVEMDTTTTDIYNLHILNCYSANNPAISLSGASSGSRAKTMNFYDSEAKLYKPNSGVCIDMGYRNSINFYTSNVSVFSNGLASPMFINSCTDCVIYLENCFINNLDITHSNDTTAAGALRDCYIFGSITSSGYIDSHKGSFVNVVMELENLNNTPLENHGSMGSKLNTVINCSEGFIQPLAIPGVSFLTSEEIRDPKKLHDAGIPINPLTGAG